MRREPPSVENCKEAREQDWDGAGLFLEKQM